MKAMRESNKPVLAAILRENNNIYIGERETAILPMWNYWRSHEIVMSPLVR